MAGKAHGVPVCMLFGGPVRTELPVYWSHCGSFRINFREHLTSPHRGNRPVPPLRQEQKIKISDQWEKTPKIANLLLRSLADVESLCEEVKESGHTALKTNIFRFDPSGAVDGAMYMPGFGGGAGSPGKCWNSLIQFPRKSSAILFQNLPPKIQSGANL